MVLMCTPAYGGEAAGDDWTPLFDGRSLNGWQAVGKSDSLVVSDERMICRGEAGYLLLTGGRTGGYEDFELLVEAKTVGGACGGIIFHTSAPGQSAIPQGYEVRLHNTPCGSGDLRKTGSLVAIRNIFRPPVHDDEWFTLRLAVRGRNITVAVNDVLLVDYTEPLKPLRPADAARRRLSRGTFALNWAGTGGELHFRSIRVKPLAGRPAGAEIPAEEPFADILALHAAGFPVIDYHVHLKGGLTIEEALAHARKTGINIGIAPNCGLHFPITSDRGIDDFLKAMAGQPLFLGMQAEGREWTTLFSPAAIARFDYVFTDAMTITDDAGRRMRLWIDKEVHIGDDREAFMEMLVGRTVAILENEPIDIYVNPTYLPRALADDYDRLWTEARMRRVIEAAVKNAVAIEINSSLRLPKPAFIKMARAAGAKFTFGTNNGGRQLSACEYGVQMVKECGLTPADMFLPRPDGRKPVQIRKQRSGAAVGP